MANDKKDFRLYSTAEIVLSMVIVAIVLSLPVIGGIVYWYWWM